MFKPICACLVAFALSTTAAYAQSAPIKAGLWETTTTSSTKMQLPPEVQAQIDAMPAQQQAMMKSRMGGAPVTTTTHSCSTGQSVKDLVNQAQQKGSDCKLTNQTQTANGASFDISCTMPQGAANGHSSFTMTDSDHVNGTMHLTAQMSGGRSNGPTNMTIDTTLTSHYLGSDCGSVAPNSAVVVNK